MLCFQLVKIKTFSFLPFACCEVVGFCFVFCCCCLFCLFVFLGGGGVHYCILKEIQFYSHQYYFIMKITDHSIMVCVSESEQGESPAAAN